MFASASQPLPSGTNARQPLSNLTNVWGSGVKIVKIASREQRHPLTSESSETSETRQPFRNLINVTKIGSGDVSLLSKEQRCPLVNETGVRRKSLSLTSQVGKRNPADKVLVEAREIASKCLAAAQAGLEPEASGNEPPTHTHIAEEHVEKALVDCEQEDSEEVVKPAKSRKKAGCRKTAAEIASNVEKFREESLSNPSFVKIHESMPSFMADYVVVEASTSPNPNEPEEEFWTAKLRVNITDKDGAMDWLKAFENVSSCDFRVKKSKQENSERLVFKKEFQCHHYQRSRERLKKNTEVSHKQTNRRSKNTSCPSIIRITILQKSMAWSSDDLLQDYPCVIYIKHHHNHPVNSADALRYRRPTEEVKKIFLQMFSQGHSPLSAIETFKFDLMMQQGDQYLFHAADGSKCPSNFWVYKLFKKVAIGQYGPQSGEGMLESLQNYCTKYNQDMESECMKVELLNERDLIVAICTPLMKRVHGLLRSAGEMMFIDSSGTMDVLNCRVFFLLAPSVAGALPLGILLVSSECEEVLKPALKCLKSIMPDKAFYGRGAEVGPKIAMTDDSPAERNSLRNAFPGIVLLLCLFHLLQAFWRYVWRRENDVPEKHRPALFHVMRDLAYAKDESTFLEMVEDAKQNPLLLSFQKVLNQITKYVERSQEWALFQREDLLTRGNDTNNYSEATMRIMKDKVLRRTKAFNPVQLVDFLVTRFGTYIEMRIADVLNNRSVNPFKSRYFICPEKLENLITEKLPSPPDCYRVTNKSKGTTYIVMMENEVCSCPVGKNGRPCKHQCAVVKDFKLSSAQFLPREQVGTEMKMVLFEIMHGHRNVPVGWFKGLHEFETSSPSETEVNRDAPSADPPSCNEDLSTPTMFVGPESTTTATDLEVLALEGKLQAMFSEWLEQLKARPDQYLAPMNSMLNFHNKVKTSDAALVSAFTTFGKSVGPTPLNMKKGNQGTIPLQVTGRARRTVILEGCHAQTGGRPPKAAFPASTQEHSYTLGDKRKSVEPPPCHWATLPKKRYAAPHSLQICVNANRMLGGTHSKKC